MNKEIVMKRWMLVVAAAALAGCATMDKEMKVPDFQPGKSTAQDVAKEMGKPAMVVDRPDGGKVEYYTTWWFGHDTYAITLDAKGVVRSVEQRLTQNNLDSIKVGMKKQQVLDALGPPRQENKEERQKLIVMEYPWIQGNREARLRYVRLSYDNVVHDVFDIHDQVAQPENH
jgi:outer membrane protein assembly factor BamE (lipoprotein component of BamABCDE complex)